jgi:hypothetical protein
MGSFNDEYLKLRKSDLKKKTAELSVAPFPISAIYQLLKQRTDRMTERMILLPFFPARADDSAR